MSPEEIGGAGTWPDFFPANCPPAGAVPATGDVFRFVEADPPAANDFRPHAVLSPGRSLPDACQACGLSIFREEADIALMRRRFKGFRRRAVARGTLGPDLGRLLPTPATAPSHHTWWVPLGAEPWRVFRVVAD